MPRRRPALATLTPAARQDVLDILQWSAAEFGRKAAARYRALMIQAMRDVEADPERPGSKKRPELADPSIRTYHLSSSRFRAAKPGVKTPRHFLVYGI